MEYDVPEKVLQILLSHRETEQACSDHSIEVCSCGANQYFGTMPQEIWSDRTTAGADKRAEWRTQQYQLSHDWKYSYHLRTIWNDEIVPLLDIGPVINECSQSDSGKHLWKDLICLWCKKVDD